MKHHPLRLLIALTGILFNSILNCEGDIVLDGSTAVYWARQAQQPIFVTVPVSAVGSPAESIAVIGMRNRDGRLLDFSRIPNPEWNGNGDAVLYYSTDDGPAVDPLFQYVVFSPGQAHPKSITLKNRTNGPSRTMRFQKAVSSATCCPIPHDASAETTGGASDLSDLIKRTEGLPGSDGTVPDKSAEWGTRVKELANRITGHFEESTLARILVSAGILVGGWFLIRGLGSPSFLQSVWIFWMALVGAGTSAAIIHGVILSRQWSMAITLLFGLMHLVIPLVLFFKLLGWGLTNRGLFFPGRSSAGARAEQRNIPPGWREWDPFG